MAVPSPQTRRTAAIAVVLTVIGFAALVGVVYGVQRALAKTRTATVTVTQPVRTVSVDTHGHGVVHVIRRAGPVEVQRTMHWAFGRPAYQQVVSGGRLTIDARARETLLGDRSTTDVTVIAPAGVAVSAAA